jgi:peroxiredoxin
MKVDVGQEAPDFELLDHQKNKVRLSDFRGRKAVLLLFYPAAFSSTCTKEFCELRDSNPDLISDRLEVVGISTDPPHALRVWRQLEGYSNTFLSDFWPHGEVARTYGVFDDKTGQAKRCSFLVDTEGTVRYVERGGLEQLGGARDQNAWREAFAAL